MRRSPRAPLVAIALALAAWPAGADAEPHARTGPCVGVGFGVASASWKETQGGRRTETSGAVEARAGYAIEPGLVVAVEFWGWATDYRIGADTLGVSVDAKLVAVTASATYFPRAGGLFVRAGAGLAYGRTDAVDRSPGGGATATRHSAYGPAIRLAPGYEWRISPRFAFGGQGEILYLGLGGEMENTIGYGASAQFNWYW